MRLNIRTSQVKRTADNVGRKIAGPVRSAINFGIYMTIFLNSTYISENLLSQKSPDTFTRMGFFRRSSRPIWLQYFIKRHFYFTDIKSAMVIVFRVIFSCLVKDLILMIFGQGVINEQISNLPKILAEDKVIDSYVKTPDRYRKKRQQLRQAQEKLKMKVLSDSDSDEDHTFLYRQGIPAVKNTLDISKSAAECAKKRVTTLYEAFGNMSSHIHKCIVFLLRSFICAVSSLILLFLYTLQVSLRCFTIVYNLIELVLRYVGRLVTDLSLVSLQILKAVTVEVNGEELGSKKKKMSSARSPSPPKLASPMTSPTTVLKNAAPPMLMRSGLWKSESGNKLVLSDSLSSVSDVDDAGPSSHLGPSAAARSRNSASESQSSCSLNSAQLQRKKASLLTDPVWQTTDTESISDWDRRTRKEAQQRSLEREK